MQASLAHAWRTWHGWPAFPRPPSPALHKPDIVSPEIRSRIDAAIERLSYRRNLVAGALASARSLTSGVIIPSIINSFFAATIEALEEGMAGSGYQLMLGNTGYSAEAGRQLVSSFLAWCPDREIAARPARWNDCGRRQL